MMVSLTRARLVALGILTGVLVVSGSSAALAVTLASASVPSSTRVNAQAAYTLSAATTKNNERVSLVVFTFPENTDLSGVSISTVTAIEDGLRDIPVTSVNVTGNVVRIGLDFDKDKQRETFTVTLDGVRSASQPGSYSYTIAAPNNTPTTVSRTYALSANATAVNVGTPVLSSSNVNTATSLRLPITLGGAGRLAGTTNAGPNTISVVFPAGYIVPASPGTTNVTIDGSAPAAVSVSGQTVTLTLPAGVTLQNGSGVVLNFAPGFGLVNPTTQGTYTFVVRTSAESGTGTSAGVGIGAPPHLTLTISANSLSFGSIDPGVTSASRTLSVLVDSSDPFTISRAISGNDFQLGMQVTGNASGSKPAGAATYIDTYVLQPPWTTDPGVTLQASVQYTVVQ